MDYRVVMLLALEAVFAYFLVTGGGRVKGDRGRLVCGILVAAAFVLRGSLFDYETTDYKWFLTEWVDFYRNNGGFAALSQSHGNYNIPYLYFLALFSYSGIRDLHLIKLLSTFFDVVLAYACMRLTELGRAALKGTTNSAIAEVAEDKGSRHGCGIAGLVCFFVMLFLPTVVMNGAMWGQCDSIYTSLGLLGIAVAVSGGTAVEKASNSRERLRPVLAMVCIAASFGFKLQAVFIMPVFLIIWVWKKYKWYDFLVFPVSYVLLILPAVILGRPFKDAILLYVDQADTVGSALNYNSPSMTAFIRTADDMNTIPTTCIVAAFAAMLIILLWGISRRRDGSSAEALGFTLLLVTAIPFFLPHMHDRYFFPADCMAVTFACVGQLPSGSGLKKAERKLELSLRIFSATLIQFGSLVCYIAYFRSFYLRVGSVYLTNDKGAAAVLIAIILSVYSMFCMHGRSSKM